MVSKLRTNIRLQEACEAYVQRITNAGQAERTVYTVKYALDRFHREIATRRDPNPYVHTITEGQVDAYCFGPGGLRQNIGAAHFNRQRSVLKKFFDYAVLMRWADVNPVLAIDRARPDVDRKRLMLNASELLALPDYCNNPIERIAVALGENTGLRANDVIHLTVFDVSLASGSIQTLIRKTDKMDDKPITVELRSELDRWFNTYRQLGQVDELPSDWLLVPSYRNAPIGGLVVKPTTVLTHPWRLVQRPLARMGYPIKGEGFHTLRRSAARVFFDSLRDRGEARDHALMIVKEFLNHSSVTMTEKYLGLNFDRVARDDILKGNSFLSSAATKEQGRLNQNIETLEARLGA